MSKFAVTIKNRPVYQVILAGVVQSEHASLEEAHAAIFRECLRCELLDSSDIYFRDTSSHEVAQWIGDNLAKIEGLLRECRSVTTGEG